MGMTKVMVISGDIVANNMGGVGIRYWEIAHALAHQCVVTLAVPNGTDLHSDQVQLHPYSLENGDLRQQAAQADLLIVHGFVLHSHPYLRELDIPLAVDLYVPYLLESLVWHAQQPPESWMAAYEEYLRVQLELLRFGDFFFCASEQQRDYWLGWLHAQKRINPHTYNADPALYRLIDVVPFGLPNQPPIATKPVLKGIHPGVGRSDKVILWSGGLWDWLDPLTPIRAVALLAPRHPEVKLYFMGTTHPNPVVTGMTMPAQALALSRELDLLDKHVFFGQWTPYSERVNYLLESDLAVTAHPNHIETRFAFRTRVLDCIWAGLPLVITAGDTMAAWVDEYQIGVTIPPGDASAMALAIEQMLLQPKSDWESSFVQLRQSLRWNNAVEPLLRFCRQPRLAPDKGHYLTETERMARAKDDFLARVSQEKDDLLACVSQEKDDLLACVSQEKDANLERAQQEVDVFRRLASFVSVIVLNYNGAHYLPTCLDALRRQNYPADRFEVIVSDNGSTDGSLELLRENYPWVRVSANGRNLGFARGNNIAIKTSRGEYVVLLNNDTEPTSTWLQNLVAVAAKEASAGLVTGRLQLFYDQLLLTITAETFMPANDQRNLSVQFFAVDSGAPRGVVQYLDGFYGWERMPNGQSFRWMQGKATLGLPVPPGEQSIPVQFQLAASRSDKRPVRICVHLREELLAEWQVQGEEAQEYSLSLPARVRSLAQPLVQNAGSILFGDGSGRDRGTYVQGADAFYEVDNDQYHTIEEVFAGCGASLLLRRSMLYDVGSLDNDLFMYYEDTDLAWRARLRGWKVLYAPDARVRHIHCGSSQEWSPFFIFHVDRNRLAMLFKNGSWQQIRDTWGGYVAETLKNTWQTGLGLLQRDPHWRNRAGHTHIRYQVLARLALWLPSLWRKRWSIQRSRTVSASEIERWFHR